MLLRGELYNLSSPEINIKALKVRGELLLKQLTLLIISSELLGWLAFASKKV